MKKGTLKLRFFPRFYFQLLFGLLKGKRKTESVKSDSLRIEIAHITNAEANHITELWLKPNRNLFVDLIEIKFGKQSDRIFFENRREFVRNNWDRFAAYNHIESGNVLRITFQGIISNAEESFKTSATYQI